MKLSNKTRHVLRFTAAMLRTIAFLVTAAALTLFTLRCTEAVSIFLNVAVLLLGITVCYYTAEYIADIWERTYFDDVS